MKFGICQIITDTPSLVRRAVSPCTLARKTPPDSQAVLMVPPLPSPAGASEGFLFPLTGAMPGAGNDRNAMTDIAEFDLAAADTRTITAHGLEAWKEEIWELAKLSAPVILTQLAQMLIMTTDIVMLGHSA